MLGKINMDFHLAESQMDTVNAQYIVPISPSHKWSSIYKDNQTLTVPRTV